MSNSVDSESLHKEYLVDVAQDVVSDINYENTLWNLKQGDKIELNSSTYSSSETLIKYDLEVTVLRGPVERYWAYRPFDPEELLLMFYAKNFPDIAHNWSLSLEDKTTK